MDIQLEVTVDWDCVNWAGDHDFTGEYDNITSYVKSIKVSGGAKRDESVYPARTCELVLRNDSGIFFLTNEESPLYEKIRLWLPIRVRVLFNEVYYPRFYGYINRITYYPITDKQTAYFYATDGIDLLAKTIVVQDMDDKVKMSDGEACNDILNAAGWNAIRRIIDLDGGDITYFPDTFAFTKE